MAADAEKTLSAEYVRKVAALSRLALTDAQVEQYRGQLSGVLGYVQRLRELNLDGVEPLANVGGETNRLDDDVPGPTLSNEALMKIAPESMPPFVKVPKVLGDGGGA
jgi:aspartyl-tRNA(Asn)/glutamyl-tRNA(Gln) amidotransferase subunit C